MVRRAVLAVVAAGVFAGPFSAGRSDDPAAGAAGNVRWFLEPLPLGPALDLLSSEKVGRELRLSPRQRAKIAELKESCADRVGKLPRPTAAARGAPVDEKVAALRRWQQATKELEAELRGPIVAVLSDPQRERFRQLVLQYEACTAMLTDEHVRAAVPLTREQKDAIRAASAQFSRDRAVGGREDQEKLLLDVLAKRDRAIEETLSGEQKAAWAKLIGSPFDVQGLHLAARGMDR